MSRIILKKCDILKIYDIIILQGVETDETNPFHPAHTRAVPRGRPVPRAGGHRTPAGIHRGQL